MKNLAYIIEDFDALTNEWFKKYENSIYDELRMGGTDVLEKVFNIFLIDVDDIDRGRLVKLFMQNGLKAGEDYVLDKEDILYIQLNQ